MNLRMKKMTRKNLKSLFKVNTSKKSLFSILSGLKKGKSRSVKSRKIRKSRGRKRRTKTARKH